jgi:LPS-assembly lipoprotein
LSPKAFLAATALALALPGCGLQPVYSAGSASAPAQLLAQISIAPIPDRSGYLVKSALQEQFGTRAAGLPYRLDVVLDDQITAFGVRGDSSAARERRTLRARFRLVDAASNNVLLDDVVASDAGIDRVSSNFAVVAAENTALERMAVDIARQISARLARYANKQPR